MKRIVGGLFLAIVSLCIPRAALADAIFSNNGTLRYDAPSQTISLFGTSTLTQVTGLGAPFDGTGNLGTVTLMSGALISGSPAPLTGQTTTFGGGGSFSVNYSSGGNSFVFQGTFATPLTWTCASGSTCDFNPTTKTGTGTWILSGTIMGGTLTENGGTPMMISNAVTVQISTVSGSPTVTPNGSIKFPNVTGTTKVPISVVPEPATLTLLGTGLVCLATYARRRAARKKVALAETS
jgi:hypothetical protein